MRTAWLFLAPTLLVLGLVAGWPLARTVGLSFTDAFLGDPAPARWVGLENYALLLSDPEWWRAVGNTLLFTGVSVSLELVLGLAIALALHRAFPGRGLMRALVLVPWAVPTVVSARMWHWMAHDLYGVVNDLGMRLGLLDAPVAWLAHDASAMGAVILADVWKATPYVALLLLAGLQAIPGELYDAARVDGVGRWAAFRHVTLPLLRPALLVALVFRTLDALRVFDLIYVMTSNAPGTATVSVYARQRLIDFQETGYGSAASVGVVLLAAGATLIWLRGLRGQLREGGP